MLKRLIYIRREFWALLSILLLLCSIQKSAAAKRLADRSFFIYDTEKVGRLPGGVAKDLSLPYVGLSLTLESSNEGVLLNGNSDTLAVRFILETVRSVLLADENRIFPLFISFKGSAKPLEELFDRVGLKELIYIHPVGEVWPDVEDLVAKNKRLVIYSFERSGLRRSNFHYAWDHIADLQWGGSDLTQFNGAYAHGDIDNELLLVRNFITPYLSASGKGGVPLDVNTDPFYLNYLLEVWNTTGKVPNFIFIESIPRSIGTLYFALASHYPLRGRVVTNGTPIERVGWVGNNSAVTNGYFCFPYSVGETLEMKPFAPGYRLSSDKITIDERSNYKNEIIIEAIPHSIYDALSGYFPLNKDLQNILRSDKIVGESVSLKLDHKRGSVCKIDSKGHIFIGECKDYLLNNRSFTTSMWVKLEEILEGVDYPLIGTSDSRYRRGLHLIIREKRPYFGFHSNDLHADYSLKEGEWYHIVFRYNILNGEQSVFINGEMVGDSPAHASFIGKGDLFIGQALTFMKLKSPAYIDDVCFWGRALGSDEVLSLYRGVRPYAAEETVSSLRYKVWFQILVLGIFALVSSYLITSYILNKKRRERESRRDSRLKQRLVVPDSRDESISSQVLIFGRFMVFDSNGVDVTKLFSTTLKKVFILLLIYTERDQSGIDVKGFSEIIWPGSDAKKIGNSRNVTLNKLRHLLEDIGAGSVENEKGWLKIEWNPHFSNQYARFLSLLKESRTEFGRNQAMQLLDIIEGGTILNRSEWAWLDKIKSEATANIIALLIRAIETEYEYGGVSGNILDYIERLILEDDLNEYAVKMKIKVLQQRGDHSLAKLAFNTFANKYMEVYGESLNVSISDFIKRIDRL